MKGDANSIHLHAGVDGLRNSFDTAVTKPPPRGEDGPQPWERAADDPPPDADEPPPRVIVPTPFPWRNPSTIPLRRWIYGRHYIRRFISQTVAPGGVGKSSIVLVELLAIVTGRPLLGVIPQERVCGWYWNGEDPDDELDRRLWAPLIHYEIEREEIDGRLFYDSGRKTKIIIAEQTRNGAKIARPVVNAVIDAIRSNDIGVFVVDPFVASHAVTENDNNAIELVAQTWAEIADATNCSIELVHHPRKTGGQEVTSEDARGGGAMLMKTRAARVLNIMSEIEQSRCGVTNRRSYFRVTHDKTSMSPPPEAADWYHLRSVDLGNGDADSPAGDSVGVVEGWQWPDAFAGVTVADLRRVQAEIRAGRWRESPQAKDWAGHAVAKVLNLDITTGPEIAIRTNRARISTMLKAWIDNRMLIVVEGLDQKREKRMFMEAGEPAND